MKLVKEIIIEVHNELRPENRLFKGKKWYQRPKAIFFTTTLVVTLVIIILTRGLKYFSAYFLIGYILLVFGLYLIMMRIYKKRVKKVLNIEPDSNIFSHWENEEYTKEYLSTLYKELQKRKVLLNSVKDIEFLTEYISGFEKSYEYKLNNSKSFFSPFKNFKVFIVPIWVITIHYVVKYFEDDIKLSYTYILIFLVMILPLVFTLNIIKDFIETILNKESKRDLRISQELRDIKMSLQLEKSYRSK